MKIALCHKINQRIISSMHQVFEQLMTRHKISILQNCISPLPLMQHFLSAILVIFFSYSHWGCRKQWQYTRSIWNLALIVRDCVSACLPLCVREKYLCCCFGLCPKKVYKASAVFWHFYTLLGQLVKPVKLFRLEEKEKSVTSRFASLLCQPKECNLFLKKSLLTSLLMNNVQLRYVEYRNKTYIE